MKVQVTVNNVKIIEPSILNENEYNIHECEFEFVEEYNGLTKKAVFTNEANETYVETIVDDKCSIPSEVLKDKENVKLGVYAYDVDNEELLLRYSPRPTEFYVHEGSYKEGQNSTPPTPSEIEQLQSQITQNANNIEELQECCGRYDSDIAEIKAEQITQNDNIQTNADNISTINTNIQELNSDISDIKEEQITQNEDIQTNKNDISDIKGEQIIQNQNIQTNAQNISNETTNRQNADNNLQSQIDAITASSDVIDVLGTYQDLVNYDTSHVKANDIIKVLQDSTHENAISYYRWVIAEHSGSWQYVGSEGPYYTKSETYNKTEVNTLLDGKVDKEQGKGLSTNDFTDAYENQIEANQNAIAGIKNGTTINDFGAVETALENKEDKANKVTELTDQSTDVEYPSAKCVYDELEAKQSEIDSLQQDVEDLRGACLSVEGTGTDITLNNTAKGRLLKNELSGRTEQEQLTGKNILNATAESYTLPATSTTYQAIVTQANKPYLEAGTKYYISYNIENASTSNTRSTPRLYLNSEYVQYASTNVNLTAGRKVWEFTPSVSGNYELQYWLQGSDVAVTVSQFMISTSSDTTYEPYCGGIPSSNPDYPQPIKNVTGNANVKIQNKNLANINEILSQSGYVSVQIINDTIKIYNNNNPVGYTPLSIKLQQLCPLLKVGDIVILSFKTTSNMSNKNAIYLEGANILWNKETTKTITQSMLDSTVALYGGNNETAVISEFQIEQGSTATSYVPHQEQNLPFTFAEGQRAMQGTTLQDNGIHNKRKQVVLDGTEDWSKGSSNNVMYADLFDKTYFEKIKGVNVICSHFIFGGTANNATEAFDKGNNKITINKQSGGQKNGVRYYFRNDNIQTLADWITFVTNQYQNRTPITLEVEFIDNFEEIIPYNETQQAQYDAKKQARSYDDITYITSTSDELGFNMNVESLANANKVINSLDTRLLALEGNTNQTRNSEVDTKNITKETAENTAKETAEDTAENAENSVESEVK